MIERRTIGGRKASVTYVDAKMQPASKDAARYIKVLFDDGEMIVLNARPKENDT